MERLIISIYLQCLGGQKTLHIFDVLIHEAKELQIFNIYPKASLTETIFKNQATSIL